MLLLTGKRRLTGKRVARVRVLPDQGLGDALVLVSPTICSPAAEDNNCLEPNEDLNLGVEILAVNLSSLAL